MIPADGRLIENASLKVDESALTGESLAVEKSMDTILEEAPLGDRTNMLFSGSFVTYGRGRAVCNECRNADRGWKDCGTSEIDFGKTDATSGESG